MNDTAAITRVQTMGFVGVLWVVRHVDSELLVYQHDHHQRHTHWALSHPRIDPDADDTGDQNINDLGSQMTKTGFFVGARKALAGRTANHKGLWGEIWTPFVEATQDLPVDKRLFVGYTVGTVFCVILTVVGLRFMAHHMSSDIVPTNAVFTDWCSRYDTHGSSSLCRDGNGTHEIIPIPASSVSGDMYERLEALELGTIRLRQELHAQGNAISRLEERLKALEQHHALSPSGSGLDPSGRMVALELILESLQHSSRSMSSRLDSELVSIARDLESIGERMHRVENHVFVSEDLSRGVDTSS